LNRHSTAVSGLDCLLDRNSLDFKRLAAPPS